MQSKTFTVPNISCGHCVAAVEEEVSEIAGVTSVKANADSKMVTVEWDTPADWDKIKAVLVEIEYPPAEA